MRFLYREDASNNPVPNLRDSKREVCHCESKVQEARVLHLETVVEERNANRGTSLRIVGVNNRIDDRFIASRRGILSFA